MTRLLSNKIKIFGTVLGILFLFCVLIPSKTSAAYPYTANYYLGELKNDVALIQTLSRYHLLVLVPTQIKDHPEVIGQIRQKNPQIIILAYLPSQSYNYFYWDTCPIFSKLKPIDESWWLRDTSGKIVSHWPGLLDTNMSEGWSQRVVDVANKYILTLPGVDGIFFDMVSEGISWINNGDIDLNNDRIKDNPAEANALWLKRTKYFLEYAKNNLKTKYILMNGSSNPELQSYVNGRMFENFPFDNSTAWVWQMKEWSKNKTANLYPQITIVNSNTANTGNSTDYKNVRFGLASALLENGYFSFDHGDQNHGQTWWYDEFNVNLGDPMGTSFSSTGSNGPYNVGVWERNFTNGLAIVNSSNAKQTVALQGEYEKIHGVQDKTINDGSIINEADIPASDGLILLKTFSSLQDTIFKNGSFVRFFKPDGSRVRNGLFVFEAGYKGGDKIAHIDLDNNGVRDLIVVSGNKVTVWRDDGQLYLREYPYGANYKGEIKIGIGDINNDKNLEIIIAPSVGYPMPVKIYSRDGGQVYQDWLPFGKTYKGGYSVAIRNSGTGKNQVLVGAGKGLKPEVYVYDDKLNLIKHWLAFENKFLGGISIASGDLDGNGIDEIIVGAGPGKKPQIKVFDIDGKMLSQFTAYSTYGTPGIEVQVADVDYDGKADVLGFSAGVGF